MNVHLMNNSMDTARQIAEMPYAVHEKYSRELIEKAQELLRVNNLVLISNTEDSSSVIWFKYLDVLDHMVNSKDIRTDCNSESYSEAQCSTAMNIRMVFTDIKYSKCLDASKRLGDLIFATVIPQGNQI